MINKKQIFDNLVVNQYTIYNNLFTNLPYEKMQNIGMLLPILYNNSQQGFTNHLTPLQIVEDFFTRYTNMNTEEEQINFLFKIIQYIERQVVLFDSIEDAHFKELVQLFNNTTFQDDLNYSHTQHKTKALFDKLANFSVRLVLTAHPTQFYPPYVLHIIQKLRDAVTNNQFTTIDDLLKQLGKTSFFNKKKPTPLDEAKSIIYYLEKVYYDGTVHLFKNINKNNHQKINYNLLQIGFWPGGDRDGNPFVTAQVTAEVAEELRKTLMKCYYQQLKGLREKLTFYLVDDILLNLSNQLYKSMFSNDYLLTFSEILQPLQEAKRVLIELHNGLFIDDLQDLITAVHIFKTHFATLDIRQDSSIHNQLMNLIVEKYNLSKSSYIKINDKEKYKILFDNKLLLDENLFEDEVIKDVVVNIKQLKYIQLMNGEQACNRYIISNATSVFDVLQVYAFFIWCNYTTDEINFDIVPLFETIEGMTNAASILELLFKDKIYKKHLEKRNNTQTIMLGFSDGTKDAGYLRANWDIYKTKEKLTTIARKHNIKIIFFDGRGGPPARGGGKTHRFYAAQGNDIANEAIQLTIQGQTISSMYGHEAQFKYNCEQLITAGLHNELYKDASPTKQQKQLMNELALLSYDKYAALKKHPKFLPYLEKMSALKYYNLTNIGSRPGKRGQAKKLVFSDLRAIAFVSAWSLLKQNVPGYFGIGTAIDTFQKQGKLEELQKLFHQFPFFKTLILNSMMSLSKSNFELTAYMKSDKEFSTFWKILYKEYELSKKMVLLISGYESLMQEEPISKASIAEREKIVLPLITIQQYALQKIHANSKHKSAYEKMVMRSLFGNINASRNSA
ncbi:MAG: phosphoenolpyruvate carboxylase [Chitinophagales bacterium]|nr:phosphoenolpyruvate carboxylase [Chitinophagales bacterium]